VSARNQIRLIPSLTLPIPEIYDCRDVVDSMRKTFNFQPFGSQVLELLIGTHRTRSTALTGRKVPLRVIVLESFFLYRQAS
jgi:hypothetical protein